MNARRKKPLLPNPCHLLDTAWRGLDAGSGYESISVDITVERDPGESAFYYYSNTVYFPKSHKDGAGDLHGVAYAGFQTNGHSGIDDRFVGKMAIFSAWDGARGFAEDGGWAARFVEDGTGYSVRVPFAWTEGVTYRLEIGRSGVDGGEQIWHAALSDTRTGARSRIGRIALPGPLRGIRNPITFHERYLGSSDAPHQVEPSQVVFSNMSAGEPPIASNRWDHIHRARAPGHRDLVWHEDLSAGVRSAVGVPRRP